MQKILIVKYRDGVTYTHYPRTAEQAQKMLAYYRKERTVLSATLRSPIGAR